MGSPTSAALHTLSIPGFIQLCQGQSFVASEPQVSVTHLLMNTNDAIIPKLVIRSRAGLQNGPRTDEPAKGLSRALPRAGQSCQHCPVTHCTQCHSSPCPGAGRAPPAAVSMGQSPNTFPQVRSGLGSSPWPPSYFCVERSKKQQQGLN